MNGISVSGKGKGAKRKGARWRDVSIGAMLQIPNSKFQIPNCKSFVRRGFEAKGQIKTISYSRLPNSLSEPEIKSDRKTVKLSKGVIHVKPEKGKF